VWPATTRARYAISESQYGGIALLAGSTRFLRNDRAAKLGDTGEPIDADFIKVICG
jgi:hypothetical protein